MREYHEIFGYELPPLPREPVLSDFYTPTDKQHYSELGFIALSMTWRAEEGLKSRQINHADISITGCLLLWNPRI